ncbi:MAG: diguanylate cyclase [Frankiales bacterium]|nr:diguanylate cyclase [Frankiales bacterium]
MVSARPKTVLIVDDEPQNCSLLTALLLPEGYVTRTATSGELALAAVAEQAPDLILLDVMMPGLDGYRVASILKADPATAAIPIIMVSALSDRDARLSGLNSGAEDFLTKPIDRAELWLRARNLLRLKELSDALHDQGAALEQQVRSRTDDLHHLAHYDSLTGLPNRGLFLETLEKTLVLGAKRDCTVAALFIDIDHFKNVNDTRGHAFGDELLRQFGHRLTGCVRIRDTVGRLGGDEFGLILMVPDGPDQAVRVAATVLESLNEPFDLYGNDVTVSASIGISLSPDDAADPEDLMRHADTAMYQAKGTGRNAFRFFTAQMNAEIHARLELEAALRLAVDAGDFRLHYQPKVRLTTGKVCGLEALLRWERPGLGLVSPLDFVPALEATGLIVGVGAWVIDEACRQVREWSLSPIGALPISVNVSGRQFQEGDLVADVARALDTHSVPAHLLELELTESMLMANTEQTIATLHELKAIGVKISVDDFGTGYSSLAYLKRFPVDTLKIDRAFVRDITTSPDDAAIALAIIRMAHSLKLDVVAEGVEDAAQLAYLRRHHCDQIQGFFFSRPLPAPEVDALLRRGAGITTGHDPQQPHDTLLLYGAEPVGLAAMRAVLTGDGYRVLAAATLDEGLELLALHPVQVIVCDQPSAANGGAAYLDLVRDLHPSVLRIVVAGSGDVEAMTHAINRSAIHRYYTDPWDVELLRADVRDAFRQYWLGHEEPARVGLLSPRTDPLSLRGPSPAHARLPGQVPSPR